MKLLLVLSIISLFTCEVKSGYLVEQKSKKRISGKANHRNTTENKAPEIQKEILNIHLIPHSHQDIGWLETFDEYYSSSVREILTGVISNLERDANKTFVLSEVAFFSRWWNEQSETKKQSVRRMVEDGRIEFVGGGWSMNDEACAYYEDIVENLERGHHFLLEEFGIKPAIAWQLDPFGHTAAQAAIFARAGYEALFLSRIDYQDKEKRKKERRLELLWSPQGYNSSIFTIITSHLYAPPEGICFNWCQPWENVNEESFLKTTVNNITAVERIVSYLRNQSMYFNHSSETYHLLGDDFAFQFADVSFKNFDLLIEKINSNSTYGLHLFYSTPSKYLKSIEGLAKNPEVKSGDFLPYADNKFSYWTGYFTSRPATKVAIKKAGRAYQVYKTFHALISNRENKEDMTLALKKLSYSLNPLLNALGLNQHHDAITGTSTQEVTDDFQKKLARAKFRANKVFENKTKNRKRIDFVRKAMRNLIEKLSSEIIQESLKFDICEWNETIATCDLSSRAVDSGKTLTLAILNPWKEEKLTVKILAPNPRVQVFDENGDIIESDIVCFEDSKFLQGNQCQVYFQSTLREYGLTFFRLGFDERKPNMTSFELSPLSTPQEIKLPGARTLTIVGTKEFRLRLPNNKDHRFSLDYKYYYSNQHHEKQNSGAYIFREQSRTCDESLCEEKLMGKQEMFHPESITVFRGEVTTQILLKSERVDCVLRFYNDKHLLSGFEMETRLNSIDVKDFKGKEVILEVRAFTIDSGDSFFTDSNGLKLIKRVKNQRESIDRPETESPSSNYYPVNPLITVIGTNGDRMSIINDRPQGGTSLEPGLIELMLHRRILFDDGRGVGEPLNEYNDNSSDTGLKQIFLHQVLFSESEADDRTVQIRNDYAPIIFQALSDKLEFDRIPSDENSKFNNIFVSENNQLLKTSMKLLEGGQILLRLQSLDPKQNLELQVPKSVSGEVLLKSHKQGGSASFSRSLIFNNPQKPKVDLQSFEARAFMVKASHRKRRKKHSI